MYRLKVFEDNYEKACKGIASYLKHPTTKKITEWMLQTEANPYSWLPEEWGGSLETANGCEDLLRNIYHALVDDGDISFIRVDGGCPRIVFFNHSEDNFRDIALTSIEKQSFFKPATIEVLYCSPDEFGALVDEATVKRLKHCFAKDAARHNIDFAVKHYSIYSCFSTDWVVELTGDIV